MNSTVEPPLDFHSMPGPKIHLGIP